MRAYIIALWISLLFLSACSWISSTYIKNNGSEVVTIKLFFDSTAMQSAEPWVPEKNSLGESLDRFIKLPGGDIWPLCSDNKSTTNTEETYNSTVNLQHAIERQKQGSCACLDTLKGIFEMNLIPGDSIHLGNDDNVDFATAGITAIHITSKNGSMELNGNSYVQSAFRTQRNNDQILFTAPTHPYVVRNQEIENM